MVPGAPGLFGELTTDARRRTRCQNHPGGRPLVHTPTGAYAVSLFEQLRAGSVDSMTVVVVAPELELVALTFPARFAWFWRWRGAVVWVGSPGDC